MTKKRGDYKDAGDKLVQSSWRFKQKAIESVNNIAEEDGVKPGEIARTAVDEYVQKRAEPREQRDLDNK